MSEDERVYVSEEGYDHEVERLKQEAKFGFMVAAVPANDGKGDATVVFGFGDPRSIHKNHAALIYAIQALADDLITKAMSNRRPSIITEIAPGAERPKRGER